MTERHLSDAILVLRKSYLYVGAGSFPKRWFHR